MIDGLSRKQFRAGRLPRLLLAVSSVLALGACAQGSGGDLLETSSLDQDVSPRQFKDSAEAVDHLARRYAANPRDKRTIIDYAKALTDSGQKQRALAVLRASSVYHAKDPEFTSVYGRTALANGHASLASKILSRADKPEQPDWRTVSARGAALAQQGKYNEATRQFNRALKLAPGNPTVLNNLAMAKAATGDLKHAEALLRKANQMPMANKKVRQNLALVLRLQGREGEAGNLLSTSANAIRSSISPTRNHRPASPKLAQIKTQK